MNKALIRQVTSPGLLSVKNVDVDSFDLLAVFLSIVSPVFYGVSSEIEGQAANFDSVDFGASPFAGSVVPGERELIFSLKSAP